MVLVLKRGKSLSFRGMQTVETVGGAWVDFVTHGWKPWAMGGRYALFDTCIVWRLRGVACVYHPGQIRPSSDLSSPL